jgi:ethanolamine utilization microcompartment shell protein EutS
MDEIKSVHADVRAGFQDLKFQTALILGGIADIKQSLNNVQYTLDTIQTQLFITNNLLMVCTGQTPMSLHINSCG